MNLLAESFAAGFHLAQRTLAPKIKHMEKQILLLESRLISLNDQRIIFIMKTTDDQPQYLTIKETDALHVAVLGGTLTATVDRPDKASVVQDPANPFDFVVTRLPAADGDAPILQATVTITDTVSGLTSTYIAEFEPGKATAMTIEAEIAPLPSDAAPLAEPAAAPAVGDTVSLPSNPADPSSPPADHTVTAVAPDGSTITATPVAGGPEVTVPAASLAASAA